MPEPLAFEAEQQAHGDSWERAAPETALIERQSWNEWLVTLPGGTAHEVQLERDHGAFIGECDCKGFEFRDLGSPCAHLCTVRKAAFGHYTDVRGRRVRILDPDEERAQREPMRADGGER